jgi:hypothetical protein
MTNNIIAINFPVTKQDPFAATYGRFVATGWMSTSLPSGGSISIRFSGVI